MADFDFITDLTSGFEVSLTNSPKKISGNRALLNRFEITFLTKKRQFLVNGKIVIDPYGGDADKFINKPRILNDSQGISAAISIAIDQTVESMKSDEPSGIPDIERIDSAELLDLDIVGDIVTANIRVNPVEAEYYDDIKFNLPIIRM